MSIFIDTSFFVSFFNKDDEYHSRATSLMETVKKGEFGRLHTSDYIIDEALTLIRSRCSNPELAIKLGASIIYSNSVKIHFIDSFLFSKAWAYFKKYNLFSFTDCTTLATTEVFKIKNILTFDSDFDRIKDIRRVY